MDRSRIMSRLNVALLVLVLISRLAAAAYAPVTPRTPGAAETAVTGPGSYAEAGMTYVLTRDVSSPRSTIFLGKDVTLDLNGHTLTYADGAYEGVPNCSFEEGLNGWDTSKAPGARVEDMRWTHPLVGHSVCVLPPGQELVSPYIMLPEAKRAYYAMVAVANHRTPVSVFVEDEQGESVECAFRFDGKVRATCPEIRRATKLGGGVVFALLHGQPAGKCRIRVAALDAECIIDEVDIRPALDVGIGIVDGTFPWAYYKCILDGDTTAFFDYARADDVRVPIEGVPRVSGSGTITIRNGVIKSAAKGIRSWGIQSTAGSIRLVLENIKFVAGGINTHAVHSRGPVTMKDCRTEIDTPWIIDRHRQEDVSVFIRSSEPCEVRNCDFVGGQGQVTLIAPNSLIHDNLFVNRQSVVNHYSLGPGGKGTRVYGNRFLPEQGSAILIGRQTELEVYDNEFRITSSPPVNEYFNGNYSVSAIRLADYGATKSSERGYCGNNRIHHNRIHVVGRKFPDAHEQYDSMAYAFFVSVGGDQNFFYDNQITVEQQDDLRGERQSAYAFYIGGSNNGGTFYGNTVTANVTPVWISNRYGAGKNVTMYGNTFAKAEGADMFVPFRLGWWKNRAENVAFFSNTFQGLAFDVHINDYTSGYTSAFDLGWTLTVKTRPHAEVTVTDADGRIAVRDAADEKGSLIARLVQYHAQGQGQVIEQGKRRVSILRTDVSEYTVRASGEERRVVMDRDREVTLPVEAE